MFKLIRLTITILIILALVTIVAPDSFFDKVPLLSDYKVFINDLGNNAWRYFTGLFDDFGVWVDERVGNIISDVFDSAEEATKDAAKDALDNVMQNN